MALVVRNFKALAFSYAILSLPYVALALSLRPASSFDQNNYRRTALDSASEHEYYPVLTGVDLGEGEVSSATVVHNIPKHLQETFYMRNFTIVGKKSEGFNITRWESDHGYDHPKMLARSPAQMNVEGDSDIDYVAHGKKAATALLGACILFSPRCGQYIGDNIGNFIVAVKAGVGQAAVEVAEQRIRANAGNLPTKRNILHEGFGCFYQDKYNGQCVNRAVTEPAYEAILKHDGHGKDTPIWTCYESKSNGVIFGYMTHCFGDGVKCELKCGTVHGTDNAPYHKVKPPH